MHIDTIVGGKRGEIRSEKRRRLVDWDRTLKLTGTPYRSLVLHHQVLRKINFGVVCVMTKLGTKKGEGGTGRRNREKA